MEFKRESVQETNVIDILHWEQEHSHKREEKSLQSYFHVLSFNELLDESRDIFQSLRHNGAYCQDLALKARLIINEISERIGLDSHGMSKELAHMKKELEKRIQKIEKVY
mgnify:CR=1 FL=1